MDLLSGFHFYMPLQMPKTKDNTVLSLPKTDLLTEIPSYLRTSN